MSTASTANLDQFHPSTAYDSSRILPFLDANPSMVVSRAPFLIYVQYVLSDRFDFYRWSRWQAIISNQPTPSDPFLTSIETEQQVYYDLVSRWNLLSTSRVRYYEAVSQGNMELARALLDEEEAERRRLARAAGIPYTFTHLVRVLRRTRMRRREKK
ncbi:hypothetical protein BJ508DRAFT_336308 [Ascobolus immersus RN42]|uniref:Uncharacterized protein n=1 Tax=Ascobolus immersus RN42 TaxID=1160509 RepID=A0A3N4H8Y7_ASCIM|nr:hypothetical protein BJ508DRAFT_336308 [Ascobolus immersus RN42]